MERDLRAILREASRRFGSKAKLAEALGINASRLSRLAHHGEYSLNIENCLKLAKLADIPAAEVLRAAGKGDIADLIASLYGGGRSDEATDSQTPTRGRPARAPMDADTHETEARTYLELAEALIKYVNQRHTEHLAATTGRRGAPSKQTAPPRTPKARRDAAPAGEQTPRTGTF